MDQPAGTIFWMVLAAIVLTALSCQLLPDIRPERSSSTALSFLQPLCDRSFALFLAAAALIQGSHAVYYAFGTLHWRAAGYTEDVIGALWAEGVVAEILLFMVGGRVLRRLGPARLLALGGLAGALSTAAVAAASRATAASRSAATWSSWALATTFRSYMSRIRA